MLYSGLYFMLFRYHVEQGEFDQGIGVIVRGHPNVFRESSIQCYVINQLDTSFTYNKNEELVSNVIKISPTGDDSLTVCHNREQREILPCYSYQCLTESYILYKVV